MKIIKKNIRQLFKFGLVGVVNTVVGTTAMFLAYNLLDMGYWFSSALNYIVGSICSYILNKYFTFESKHKSPKEVFRFIVNIAICYLIAYGIAEPCVRNIIFICGIEWGKNIIDQLAMLVGMFLFVILNFLGQKLFVFRIEA